jgi:hypothetical protein
VRDRLAIQLDSATLIQERPDLDPRIVEGLYRHLSLVHGHPPALEEARAYVDRATRTLDLPTLWEQLDLPVPYDDEPAAEAPAQTAAPALPSTTSSPRPRRGRPRGRRSATRQQIVERYHSLQASTGRPPTQAELASNLVPAIAARTLQKLLAEYGMVWPPD